MIPKVTRSDRKNGDMPERPTRILFLNHVSKISGAEQGLLDIVKCLDRKKFKPLVVIPSHGTLADILTQHGVQTACMPLKRFKKTSNPLVLTLCVFNLFRVIPRLARLIRQERIDILHANSNNAQIYGGLAAKLAGIPSVWHSRDLVDLGLLGKWLYRLSSKTIAISDAVDQHLRQYISDGEKLVTIHNGIDVEKYHGQGERDAVRNELGIGKDRFVIAMAGQLVPWKNHPLFLRAASLIAGEVPDAYFLVIGDDLFGDHMDYRKSLQDLVQELDLSERINFTGYRTDIVRVLDSIDLLVHPASREPFGRVILEAMALGKPVVAVDSCGPGEIIRNEVDGILTPADNPEEMAKAAVRLAKNKDLALRIGVAARERVMRDFNLSDFAKKIEAVYEEVLI